MQQHWLWEHGIVLADIAHACLIARDQWLSEKPSVKLYQTTNTWARSNNYAPPTLKPDSGCPVVGETMPHKLRR